MIIDQVNVYRLAALETEDESPVAGYADTPLPTTISLQPMQPPSRQVHVLWRVRVLQRGQHAPEALHMSGI